MRITTIVATTIKLTEVLGQLRSDIPLKSATARPSSSSGNTDSTFVKQPRRCARRLAVNIFRRNPKPAFVNRCGAQDAPAAFVVDGIRTVSQRSTGGRSARMSWACAETRDGFSQKHRTAAGNSSRKRVSGKGRVDGSSNHLHRRSSTTFHV